MPATGWWNTLEIALIDGENGAVGGDFVAPTVKGRCPAMQTIPVIACFGTVIVGLVILPTALGQDKAPAVRILVVKTWKNLQELPPIDLGDGVKIRLGLEADKVPQWSGILLYCLTEGFTPLSGGNDPSPLGPVHVTVNFGSENRRESQLKHLKSQRKEWPKGSYLFVRSFAVDRVGIYQVRVKHSQGQLLAEAPLEGTKDFFHPWMPWIKGYSKHVAPTEGIALPLTDSFGPVAFLEPAKMKSDPLPTLLPAGPTAGFTILLDGDEIVILSAQEFTTSRPEYHFLARWWINDKPFVPMQLKEFPLSKGYGLVSEGKELRLRVLLQPESLRAKAGDKIGVQLMYCEGGWEWCAGQESIGLVHAQGKNGEPLRISNRIHFSARANKAKEKLKDAIERTNPK